MSAIIVGLIAMILVLLVVLAGGFFGLLGIMIVVQKVKHQLDVPPTATRRRNSIS
jgi:hypothetical protein